MRGEGAIQSKKFHAGISAGRSSLKVFSMLPTYSLNGARVAALPQIAARIATHHVGVPFVKFSEKVVNSAFTLLRNSHVYLGDSTRRIWSATMSLAEMFPKLALEGARMATRRPTLAPIANKIAQTLNEEEGALGVVSILARRAWSTMVAERRSDTPRSLKGTKLAEYEFASGRRIELFMDTDGAYRWRDVSRTGAISAEAPYAIPRLGDCLFAVLSELQKS